MKRVIILLIICVLPTLLLGKKKRIKDVVDQSYIYKIDYKKVNDSDLYFISSYLLEGKNNRKIAYLGTNNFANCIFRDTIQKILKEKFDISRLACYSDTMRYDLLHNIFLRFDKNGEGLENLYSNDLYFNMDSSIISLVIKIQGNCLKYSGFEFPIRNNAFDKEIMDEAGLKLKLNRYKFISFYEIINMRSIDNNEIIKLKLRKVKTKKLILILQS